MLKNYPDVLNIHDLCEILRIGKKTAYKLLHEGKIPCRKIGRMNCVHWPLERKMYIDRNINNQNFTLW